MKLFNKINENKKLLAISGTLATIATAMTPIAFAADTTTAMITPEMFEPLLTGLKDNVAVILPVGMGIMVIIIGIGFIINLTKKFTKS